MGCKGKEELSLNDCPWELKNNTGDTISVNLKKRMSRYVHLGIWKISFTIYFLLLFIKIYFSPQNMVKQKALRVLKQKRM